MKNNTLAWARRYVKDWAYRLRLQDWKITVEVAGSELEAFAHTNINRHHNTANITVRNPVHTPSDNAAVDDLEVTVVHELLHLRFLPVELTLDDRDLKPPKEHEASIDLTAQALVSAARNHRRLF